MTDIYIPTMWDSLTEVLWDPIILTGIVVVVLIGALVLRRRRKGGR